MMNYSMVRNNRTRRKLICMFCLVLFPFVALAQVEDFTKRLDELTKTVVIPQAEHLLRSNDSILNQDSVLFFPLFLFRQDINNVDKEKYLDYSFLNGLQWTALVPDKSIYPFELMISDLNGNIKFVFMHASRLKNNSWYAEFFDSNGDEVLKKLLVKLLYNGFFDYAFVTSVPVIEEKTISIHQQGRDGMCFCIKNGQVYVLFRDCQLFTMEEFVKRYWNWFDVKTSDTYSGQSTEEAPCITP